MEEQLKKIEHSHLPIRGLNLHVAQIGEEEKGTVVFLHGFPEIWYSWRHQMLAAAAAGFRAIAPDFRGYGLSDKPSDDSSWGDLVADLLALLDSLAIPKVFLVGKDFGALIVYQFAILHPKRVIGVVTLGVPFIAKRISHDSVPSGFYFARWQEPGRAELDFSRFDVKTVVRNIYIMFSGSEFQIVVDDQEIIDLVDPSTPLPPWFSEEDLAVYASLYEKSGFHFRMLVPYQKWKESSDVIANVVELEVQVPTLLIMGDKDYDLRFPGLEDYVKSGKVRDYVPGLKIFRSGDWRLPDLEIAFLPEGTHFVQEQFLHQEMDIYPIPDFGQMKSKHPTEFFCKNLTASDTSTHGDFSVPCRAAEKLFSQLDYSMQPSNQEVVRDLHDNLWTF